jgi:hypothetical protein
MTNEKLKAEIFIDGAHKLGKDLYVQGRIHGIMTMICKVYDTGVPFGVGRFDEGVYMRTYCTRDEFDKLKEKVENEYVGLCKVKLVED